MNGKIILVHDPYDVFLAVGFGFCYCSAIFPTTRLIEKLSRENTIVVQGHINNPLRSKSFLEHVLSSKYRSYGMIVTRGILTVIGLACLYSWYAIYLKSFYMGEVPVYRQLLDWVSLGLFAVGANCWDDQDHHQRLYCLVQAGASIFFGFTCFLTLPSHPTDGALPLLKAIFWCTIIVSSYLFYLILPRTVEAICNLGTNQRSKFIWLFIASIALVGSVVALDWWVFHRLGLLENIHKSLGWPSYAGAGVLFVVIWCLGIGIEKIPVHWKWRSFIMTCVPMSVLIWVTYRNWSLLFPNG